ncbi:hypothetical protein OA501_02250 [Flavobacteriaceae bacterium]|nr:hypothetical protein [Flavobacteriaceae bacterium]
MKFKLLTVSFLMAICNYGQTKSLISETTKVNEAPKKNELKINAFELLVNPAIGINYERNINKYSSYGVYGFINFQSGMYRYENFEIAPFYRQYFGDNSKINGSGFFSEFFAAITSVDFYENYYYDSYYGNSNAESNDVALAMGILIGYKWINLGNFIFEMHLGVGRYLSYTPTDSAYPRLGFMIGKRF